jgi:hypothetical protein
MKAFIELQQLAASSVQRAELKELRAHASGPTARSRNAAEQLSERSSNGLRSATIFKIGGEIDNRKNSSYLIGVYSLLLFSVIAVKISTRVNIHGGVEYYVALNKRNLIIQLRLELV